MANGQQLSLEILIKTIADTRGIAVTEGQIKGLADSMREASAAGKPLETSGDSIAAALQNAGKASGTFSEASKTAGKSLSSLNQAGAGASQMLSGLEQASQGGMRGIIGIGNAFRGFLNVVRTAITSSGPIGILITVLGLAAGAFLALRGRTKEAGESLDKTKGAAEGANKALAESAAKAAEAEKQMKELADKGLSAASKKAKELEDQFNKATEAIKRTAEAASKVRAAEADLELARIDAAEAGGKLSQKDAEAARFTVKRAASRGDLRAQQKLADDLESAELARVKAAEEQVGQKESEGVRLAGEQNRMLDRRGELKDEAGQIKEAARVARLQKDEEIEALRKERALLVKSGDPVADRGITGRQRQLDEQIVAAESARDKEQHEFAAQVTPIAKEMRELDAGLVEINEALAESSAALQGFRDALKAVSAQSGERITQIKDDIKTTTTVAGIQEEAQALRNPELTKAADVMTQKSVKSGGTITTKDGRSVEVASSVDQGGTSGGIITTGNGRRVQVASSQGTSGEEAAIRAAGKDAAASINGLGKETIAALSSVHREADKMRQYIKVTKESRAGQ